MHRMQFHCILREPHLLQRKNN